jgi:hypothetical protein
MRAMTWGQVQDPWTSGTNWKRLRAELKEQWAWERRPCAQCGGRLGPIRYDLPHPHPLSLHVGHRVSRAQARRQGWTEQMANDPSNLRAEHAKCSAKSGRVEGNKSPTRRYPQGTKPQATSSALLQQRDPYVITKAEARSAQLRTLEHQSRW